MTKQQLLNITKKFDNDEILTHIEQVLENKQWDSNKKIPFEMTHFELRMHHNSLAGKDEYYKVPEELNEVILEAIKKYHEKLKTELVKL